MSQTDTKAMDDNRGRSEIKHWRAGVRRDGAASDVKNRQSVDNLNVSAVPLILPALLPDEDADAGGDGEDGQRNAGLAEAEAGDADYTDEDEVDGEEEHADAFSDIHMRVWVLIELGGQLTRGG